MKGFKLVAILFLILQLVLPMSVSAQEAENLDYLALGDSLAAGIQETGELGLSYADFLALSMTEEYNLSSYNKGFAYPGYTTADVLNDIKNNVTKPIYNADGLQSESVAIRDAIANAEVITISAGANDILKHFNKETLEFDLKGAFEGIQQMGKNYEAILKEIIAINPDAYVLIMGYYNPFPYLDDSLQVQLDALVSAINKIIREASSNQMAIFVDTAEYIASDFKTYLPNPQNIHLSEAGYKLVADLFLNEIYYYLYNYDEEEFEYYVFTDTEGHWAEEYASFVATTGIMNGYDDGSFKPDQELKRVQLASIVSRIIGDETAKAAPFKDISSYAKETQQAIAVAYEVGVMNGNGNSFNPEEKVTRAQMALIISRLYEYFFDESYEPEKIAPFKDIAGYDLEAQKAITLLYDYQIVQGVGDNKFAPKDSVTRAQAAKIITEFIFSTLFE
ncbi:S-layer homology domain-containing protein [Bacillus ndiopicus]|uniref:S-layer homology domain-containing protein n=1 Tax=Bacillus ndiopicus TaxID=1347368 RepID=UPI0005A9FE1A|nr:S-layer homology domain-containing protein [Bacillus ndiopicus]